MRICLVDDDSTQLEYLKHIIGKWSNEKRIYSDMSFFHSAEEMLFENNDSYPFDMIILDIQMGKMNGIELAKEIRKKDKKVIIAFISGIADYVYEGYEVQAVRYILKPVKKHDVYKLLESVTSRMNTDEKYLILSIAGEKKKVNYNDILYFESMGHYVVVHLENEEFEYKYNIGTLYNDLGDSQFIKTHRSYIINIKYLEKITRSECQLINHIKVPLSRNSYKLVNEKFIDYYKGKGV